MKKEDIISVPKAALRTRSTRVSKIDDRVRELVTEMIQAGLDWEDSRDHELCVGLAAVQVDILERIVVLRVDTENRENREFVAMINPKIVKTYGKPIVDFEGCLSVPDIYGKVARYPKVKVQALDENGDEFRMTVDGFASKLVQHEVDHTNGIVFIDHIKEDPDAFFSFGEDGKLFKMDYDKDVKDNQELWGEV